MLDETTYPSQISMVEQLKFRNAPVISSNCLWWIYLLIQARVKVKQCSQNALLSNRNMSLCKEYILIMLHLHTSPHSLPTLKQINRHCDEIVIVGSTKMLLILNCCCCRPSQKFRHNDISACVYRVRCGISTILDATSLDVFDGSPVCR